ncbi:MAG: YkvA family protein [Blastocatellia bacterium]
MSNKIARIERRESRNVLQNAVMLIPNFVKLLYRLYTDSRVPLAEKAFLTGAIVYVVSPLDLIPDIIPFVGQVDDLYLVSLTILRLLMRTPDEVIREHWEGNGDIAGIVGKIATAAKYVLPRRIQQILLGRVDIAPKYKDGFASSPAAPEEIEPHIDARRREKR